MWKSGHYVKHDFRPLFPVHDGLTEIDVLQLLHLNGFKKIEQSIELVVTVGAKNETFHRRTHVQKLKGIQTANLKSRHKRELFRLETGNAEF
jgi:hypothetical protein